MNDKQNTKLAKLGSFTISFHNSEEYHHLKQEIFTQDGYYFETDNPSPVIIDAGAHIGLATLYFKKLYPAAHITAIEPHPENFTLLEKNVFENQLADVQLVQAALNTSPGHTTLYADRSNQRWFSTAGFIEGAWNRQQKSEALTVPTLPLSDFLQQPIDFLKLDIEGAELAVLTAAGNNLTKVKHMMIEFHPGSSQSLIGLLETLTKLGFRTRLWKHGQEVRPEKIHGLVLVEAFLPRK